VSLSVSEGMAEKNEREEAMTPKPPVKAVVLEQIARAIQLAHKREYRYSHYCAWRCWELLARVALRAMRRTK